MPDWMLFVLSVFAVYRVARLIAIDEGPFRIFFKIRLRAGAYNYDQNGHLPTNLARGIVCPYCIGFYVSLIAAFLFFDDVLLAWLAIAGAQAFLQGLNE